MPRSKTRQTPPIAPDNPLNALVRSPLRFVQSIFPWGHGLLEGESGPDTWQCEVLEAVERQLLASSAPVQLAVASGHGVGKTALTAWLVYWFLSTRPHPHIVVTANTMGQLVNKTWRELAKWHKLAKNTAWFHWTATKLYHVEHQETWFASAMPWSADRSEGFAGTHAEHVLMIFDEASAIDEVIWEVASGAMTSPRALWLVFGNPTRNTGRFKECFPGGRFAHRWQTYQVDSRTAKKADQTQIRQWIEDYGEDSDFVRVRVLGQFPHQSSDQFISEALIAQAHQRFRETPAGLYAWAPIVCGVDAAWKGPDESVILVRQGGSLLHREVHREMDPAQLGERVIKVIEEYRPDAVFIDEVGIGASTLLHCRMRGYDVFGVNAGKTKDNPDPEHYHAWGDYMWGQAREWLATVGCLDPDDRVLATQLTAREYSYDHLGRYILESKDEMRGRGLASPDHADALGFTFAQPVTRRGGMRSRGAVIAQTGYNVLDYDRLKRPGYQIARTDYDVFHPPGER
jgi:hypothetical protein